MARVSEECKRHTRMLDEQLTELERFSSSVERGQLSTAVALSRLTIMFPTASVDSLYRCVSNQPICKSLGY